MNFRKTFGLLAIAAVATMALAANASATKVATITGTAATPAIHFTNEGSHLSFKNALITVSCASTLEAKIGSHGGTYAEGIVTHFTFTSCTNNWHTTVINNGTIAIDWENGYNGIVRSTGATIDATRFGLTCEFETNETLIGTIVGGNPATFNVVGDVPINSSTSGASCGTGKVAWSGSYVTTSALYVES